MNYFFTCIACSLLFSTGFSTNYYISTSGSDTNPGTSSSSPLKTIGKLNTKSFSPGDTIFFKSGEIFRGVVKVNQSGNSSKQIVFTSYGSGNLPIISGAETLSSWALSGSYYQASISQAVTNFFVNDKEQILARYPNDHQYLDIDEATTTSLKDASLSGISASLITGAKICIHTAQWCWEKTSVSSYSGTQITYTNPTHLAAMANYGYFLYDNLSHLDVSNEWKYDASSQKIYYIPSVGQNPNSLNCEASVYTNGIEFNSSASYITVINLAFEKQSNAGVAIYNNTNQFIKIDNCQFARQYNYGVNDKGKYNEISNCYFREVDGIAIMVNGSSGGNCTIHHNIFRNNGQYRNSGIGTEINCTSICCAFINDCYIHHNDIDSAGYCGISVDGENHIVERNIVKNAMLLNNDGAALKSYGSASKNIIFRNNFVSTSDGNTEGTYNGDFSTPGIYFDFFVSNSLIENNTIYNHTKRGIFQNSGTSNNSISGNVVYGSSYCLEINGGPQTGVPVSGLNVKHNVFFSLNNQDYIIKQIDYTNTFNQGTLDSNYYFQPYNANNYALRMKGQKAASYSFSSWQATGNDAHTKSSFVSWTSPTNNSVLFMNPTDTDSIINLGSTVYQDLDGNPVCGNITLDPYTSKLLIATSNSVSIPSVSISASSDSICSGTSVTFTAIPTNGGTSPTYQWKVDGNNVGTNSSTYTSSALTDGQVLSCVITSSESCVSSSTATSNSITMTVSSAVTPSLAISASLSSICSGTSVTFTAIPTNGGTSPSYQWKVDGNNVGTNSSTYTSSGLTDGQVISCVITSSEGCVSSSTATSNSITMTVSSSLMPSVSIAITSGSNPTTAGASVTFTATPTNGGTNPTYQWKVNSKNVGSNSATYSTSSLTNGQNVKCILISDLSCAIPKKVVSSPIKMYVYQMINGVTSANSIEGDETFSFQIYPNPSNGDFTISFQTLEKTSFILEIRNVVGQLLYQEETLDFYGIYEKQINNMNWGKGLFVIRLYNNEKICNRSLLIE